MSKSVVVIIVIVVAIVALPLVAGLLKGESGSGASGGDPAASPPREDPNALETAKLGSRQVKCSAIGAAILNGDLERVKALIDNGADLTRKIAIHEEGESRDPLGPVFLAVDAISNRGASMELVPLLVKNGADIDSGAPNNMTPLHTAVMLEEEKIVRALIAAGANVNARESQKGLTPLSISSDLAIAKLIREHGGGE